MIKILNEQNFSILRHLVGEISHFEFDAYRVTLTGASDLKHFVGVVHEHHEIHTWLRHDMKIIPQYWFFVSSILVDPFTKGQKWEVLMFCRRFQQAIKQTIQLPAIWDAMILICFHCDDIFASLCDVVPADFTPETLGYFSNTGICTIIHNWSMANHAFLFYWDSQMIVYITTRLVPSPRLLPKYAYHDR